MDPFVPYVSFALHGDAQVDSSELEEYHSQVDEIVIKVDDIAQKLKEVEQFYSATNKKEQNTSKINSILKDKDKDKLIANLKKRQQDAPHKEEAATKRMMALMRQFNTIISQVTSQHKWAIPFMKPVDVVGLGLHDYYKVIEKPMDFSTIKKRMDCKDGSGYKHVREIWADVRLVFKNAMKYNDEKHDVHEMARYLLSKFEDRWLDLFPKVAEEDARLKEEEAQKLLDMRLTQEVAHAKMTRDLSNELDELDMHLEELKGLVLQNYRKMTTEEKRRLATTLTRLPAEDLNEALLIVAEDNPCFQPTATEVDLDIDSQGELTLWKLKFFLKDKLQEQAMAAAAAAGRKDNSNHNNNDNSTNTNNNNYNNNINSKPLAAKNNHNNMNKRKREICDAIAQNLQKRAKETTSLQVHNPRK
ncbi:transcription factor GTE1-like [Impatiens glandulifera]|uniref:transcription factor GTE1-like n=1 Tax=Impatiens glandulifera TaxID=253017 RepID=UPI001FB0AA55|nr:transcription factor GTE1-like [Impatiens glandulifera]